MPDAVLGAGCKCEVREMSRNVISVIQVRDDDVLSE